MTQSIKWSETSDKDKVRLILEHILQWQVVESLHAERTVWPVACYYSNERYPKWIVQDRQWEPFKIFDPLRSMSDAWLVVRKVNEPVDGSYALYAAFVDELERIVGSDMFFDLFYCDKDGDHLSPERICIAALRAVGLIVEM